MALITYQLVGMFGAHPSEEPASVATKAPHASKTRLLEAALEVIRTKGYAATTVEDICARAGVSKGSFFHHFAGRRSLPCARLDSGTR